MPWSVTTPRKGCPDSEDVKNVSASGTSEDPDRPLSKFVLRFSDMYDAFGLHQDSCVDVLTVQIASKRGVTIFKNL
jgi:hypothetical protein